MTKEGSPLACVPDAVPSEERASHLELTRRLMRAARERVEVDGGFGIRFGPADLADLAAFVRNERRCCPFLRFRIEQEPDEGPLWLYLTGPDGTRAFLNRELQSAL